MEMIYLHYGEDTFLHKKTSLRYVDALFRQPVKLLNSIPFCATFGDSCSGHFSETNSKDNHNPNTFKPLLYVHLNIIFLVTKDYNKKLIKLIQKVTKNHTSITFKKIQSVKTVEIWRIEALDKKLETLNTSTDWPIPKKGNRNFYKESKKRYEEISKFWKDLERVIYDFCRRYGFKEFNPRQRENELVNELLKRKNTKAFRDFALSIKI